MRYVLVMLGSLVGLVIVAYLLSYIFVRKKDKSVSLYIDKVLNEMWQFMGIVCLAVALMAAYRFPALSSKIMEAVFDRISTYASPFTIGTRCTSSNS